MVRELLDRNVERRIDASLGTRLIDGGLLNDRAFRKVNRRSVRTAIRGCEWIEVILWRFNKTLPPGATSEDSGLKLHCTGFSFVATARSTTALNSSMKKASRFVPVSIPKSFVGNFLRHRAIRYGGSPRRQSQSE